MRLLLLTLLFGLLTAPCSAMDMTWAEFRDHVITQRKISFGYLEHDGYYDLWANFQGERYATSVTTDTADADDFVNSYLALGNKPSLVGRAPFAVDTHLFQGDGLIFTASSGTTTSYDYQLTQTLVIAGGMAYTTDAIMGDYITIQVVDVDGIFLPAGTVLKTFINKWYVPPGEIIHIQTPNASEIYAGLYLRVKYISTGGEDVKILLNLLLYAKL